MDSHGWIRNLCLESLDPSYRFVVGFGGDVHRCSDGFCGGYVFLPFLAYLLLADERVLFVVSHCEWVLKKMECTTIYSQHSAN
jgi:hypothetical protein